MRARLVLALVLVLVATACDPGDIELVLDQLPSEDLSQSDDPGERSAGASAIEILTIREAEENLDRGLATLDVEAVQQAERLRPDDPRYDFYEAAILAGADPTDLGANADATRAQTDGGADFGRAHPELEGRAKGLGAVEAYMNALREVISLSPPGDARDRRVATYCRYINNLYPEMFTGEFPQQVSLYLALEADFSVCS